MRGLEFKTGRFIVIDSGQYQKNILLSFFILPSAFPFILEKEK
jgi:hypothetical protein